MKEEIKKKIIKYIPYILLAYLGSKICAAWELSEGVNFAEKFLHVSEKLSPVFSSFLLGMSIKNISMGILFSAFVRIAVFSKSKNEKKFRKNEEYGSARWGTRKDIQPFMDPLTENNLILTKTEMLTMNPRPKDPRFGRNKNVLVVGGSGSGKTRFFVKPNILQAAISEYPISLCITDPKTELLLSTADFMQKSGYAVKVFNTIDFSSSMHYNPFEYIHSEKDILKLVTALIANTKGEGKAGDDFWVKAETLLYCALIGYLWYEADDNEKNFATMISMLNEMQIHEDDDNFKNSVDFLFEELEEKNKEHFAVRMYRKFKLSAGKTSKSILISAAARLTPFDIKEVRDITMYDELELDLLGDRKTALYLVMSDNDPTFNFLISMIYTQLFNSLVERADNYFGGRLPVHVRCLIDECANIGQIPNLEKLMATIRSREISACLIWQTNAQIKSIYKENAETIIGNCDSQLFLGGSEPTTLKNLSEALGKETIDMFNTGESRGVQVSHSMNYQKLGKSLMSTDEIAILDSGKCVLQLRGVRPFLSDKYEITGHPAYSRTSDYDKKYTFDIKGLIRGELHIKPLDTLMFFDFVNC